MCCVVHVLFVCSFFVLLCFCFVFVGLALWRGVICLVCLVSWRFVFGNVRVVFVMFALVCVVCLCLSMC